MSKNNVKIEFDTDLTSKGTSILLKTQRQSQILSRTNEATHKMESHKTDSHQRITYTSSGNP